MDNTHKPTCHYRSHRLRGFHIPANSLKHWPYHRQNTCVNFGVRTTKYQYYYHSKPYYITAPSCLAFLYEIWFKGNSVIPDHWPLTFLVSFLTSSLTIKKVSSLTSSLTIKKNEFAHRTPHLSLIFHSFFLMFSANFLKSQMPLNLHLWHKS